MAARSEPTRPSRKVAQFRQLRDTSVATEVEIDCSRQCHPPLQMGGHTTIPICRRFTVSTSMREMLRLCRMRGLDRPLPRSTIESPPKFRHKASPCDQYRVGDSQVLYTLFLDYLDSLYYGSNAFTSFICHFSHSIPSSTRSWLLRHE